MTPLDEANLGWARAERERDEARTEADQLRLAHSRLLDTLREYDCDYGCGCTHRHCPEGRPCLAHRLDEVREELRVARLGAHAGQSCEVLAARLVAVEKERDNWEDEANRWESRWLGLADVEKQLDVAADVARRQREACSQVAADWARDAWLACGEPALLYDAVDATPLLTEETP